MKETIITVPEGIRYLSEWTDFENQIPHGQHFILNKAHTGVGATQYYLSNPQKVILCSPRVALIENKRSKHPGVCIYRDLSDSVASDTDGKSSRKKKKATYQDIKQYNSYVVQYVHRCIQEGKVPKIMTTYDSLGHVYDALSSISSSEPDSWLLVIDEFQAIFGDAAFKSLTEMQLLNNTAKFKSVIYLSATPFLKVYMEQMNEFKNLPYILLKWPPKMKEKALVTNITIKESRNKVCGKIIANMKAGKTVKYGSKEIDTTEAVFYVNSVSDILSIIKSSGLGKSEVNILCSKNNEDRIKKAGFSIGTIPAEGEEHKPFTFCTRSYFLGCDFNSTCAYSYVFADPKSTTLALDISTDLSQILGRQRLDSNPYRNEAILFIREGSIGFSDTEFGEYIKQKKEKTERKIRTFKNLKTDEEKRDQIGMIRSDIDKNHFSNDYLYIANDAIPQVGFNIVYMLAEKRAWEIRTKNYTSQYTVIRQQKAAGIIGSVGSRSVNPEVLTFKSNFEGTTQTDKRINLYCNFRRSHPELIGEVDFVSSKYSAYWDAVGYEGMAKVGFQESKIKAVMEAPSPFEDRVITEVRQLVNEGDTFTPEKLKELLKKAYERAGCTRTPKACDIEDYITVKKTQDGKTGKRRYVINSIYQKNISFFPHVWLPNRHKEITIDRFLDIIQKGTYSTSKGQQNRTIADVIIEIRGKTDPDEIAKMKKDWLPVACINGVFETKHDHSITTYSSFVALDYDHFADDVAKEKAKDHLKQFPFVYAIFETPSGHGIKALILHDSVNPEHHFNLFTQLLKVCSLPEIDNVVSDISRGQFFSYDPGLWRNPSPEAFHFEYDPSITPPSPKKEMSVNGEKGIVKLDSGTTAFLHKLWEMVLTDDAVIERLDKHWHEQKPEYFKVGNRHSGLLVITGTLCKAGIPQEKAKAYLDKTYSNMPASEIDSILSYAYNHNPFGSDRRKYGRW